jgi:hypothetical protein
MKPECQSAAKGLWAVAWRSIVFLPVMLGMFLFLLVHVAGLFMLPFLGTTWLWFGLWQKGFASFAVWLLLLWSWRHFRLRGRF